MGTSNKSELLLGYGTQYGDMASAINPMGDVYKTQLRQLAAHLAVPADVLAKSPSGDLWVGQTDEEELGFSYADVDRLLMLLVDERWPPARLVRAGFDAEFVDLVATRACSATTTSAGCRSSPSCHIAPSTATSATPATGVRKAPSPRNSNL